MEVAPIDYDCFEILKTVIANADFNTTRADSPDCHTTIKNNLQTRSTRTAESWSIMAVSRECESWALVT